MNKYRVVRYGDRYRVQRWFDRRSFLGITVWRAGWYYWSWSSDYDWTLDANGMVHSYPTLEAAKKQAINFAFSELPLFDPEPPGGLGDEGEALREQCKKDYSVKPIFSDWMDEHGFPGTASRLRLEYEAESRLVKESEATHGQL